jgi:hypothetical protein
VSRAAAKGDGEGDAIVHGTARCMRNDGVRTLEEDIAAGTDAMWPSVAEPTWAVLLEGGGKECSSRVASGR